MCEERGITSELVPRIATGFCGGMARAGEMCGAVSGAVMALSVVLGRDDPDGPRDADYAAVRTLLDSFADSFGSTNCRELLGCDLGTPEGQAFYKKSNLSRRCRRYTEEAARMVAALLDEG
ncbi:MAG: C_GCAxxG_C_C family protein [Actinobacteria bacterium]|nr:C_GCAxxG_C_C family protein [Actinomycetota bacterium]